MSIKNVEILGLMNVVEKASLIKHKVFKDNPPDQKIKDFVSLPMSEKEFMMKHVYVRFNTHSSMYFIKKILSYNIIGFTDISELLLKKKKFIMENNNEKVLQPLFNIWLSLFEGLSKFKNDKEKRYSVLLNKEVNKDELYEYIIMNMPSGLKFECAFVISYYELKQFVKNEKDNSVSEIKEFIKTIKKLTLFNELVFGGKKK